MSDINAVAQEIRNLTSNLIGVGLCVDQNFPKISKRPSKEGQITEISISGLSEISAALRHRPYLETYNELGSERSFNMKLIDGALIQMRYLFSRKELKKHVLSFLPSPDLLEYQNEPEIYENDILYSEIILKDIVTSPIRFDYDADASVDYIHPTSHCTFGQYKNCRIPVLGALTPFRFVNLILRSFYNTAFNERCSDWSATTKDFSYTLTSREQADMHWSFGRADM
ncbi:DUF2290 domain-containing protein [Acetobacter fabarum]|uniref:DUF2290 domain-containing protein n=1 Tax=Acetobacter fabarum TaxID=483199 RepID=UPI0014045778|nr:DUF2290 domain-containing protein [Acetobacter fabarum]NHO42934.1 DUF2290 domain-containing protein [Acetobacter fabarum]GBQ33972.1 hypothetical protein AA19596_1359 [Acetobacter fabarum DSM 19596]